MPITISLTRDTRGSRLAKNHGTENGYFPLISSPRHVENPSIEKHFASPAELQSTTVKRTAGIGMEHRCISNDNYCAVSRTARSFDCTCLFDAVNVREYLALAWLSEIGIEFSTSGSSFPGMILSHRDRVLAYSCWQRQPRKGSCSPFGVSNYSATGWMLSQEFSEGRKKCPRRAVRHRVTFCIVEAKDPVTFHQRGMNSVTFPQLSSDPKSA